MAFARDGSGGDSSGGDDGGSNHCDASPEIKYSLKKRKKTKKSKVPRMAVGGERRT